MGQSIKYVFIYILFINHGSNIQDGLLQLHADNYFIFDLIDQII
jgi:hypothetical protein